MAKQEKDTQTHRHASVHKMQHRNRKAMTKQYKPDDLTKRRDRK